ncbi:MAG TPA: hypothetical protein VGL40_12100 [Bacillota bacterium]|jgi:hypothetical protein
MLNRKDTSIRLALAFCLAALTIPAIIMATTVFPPQPPAREPTDIQVVGGVTLGMASILIPDLGRVGITTVLQVGKAGARAVRVEFFPGAALSNRAVGPVSIKDNAGPFDFPADAISIRSIAGECFFDAKGPDFATFAGQEIIVARISWDEDGTPRSQEWTLTDGPLKPLVRR